MRYVITLEGTGGELDRRTCDTEEEFYEAVLDLAVGCTLAAGDTIRIIDTQPEK